MKMPSRLLSLQTAGLAWPMALSMAKRLLLALAFSLLAMPGVSFAQSACTAMWAIVTTGGAAPARLAYFNNSAGTAAKFTTLSFTLSGGTNANALAGDPTTGILYYFDRTALTIGSANLNTGVTATVGTISPAAPGGNGNIIGAYNDAAGNLIFLSGGGTYYVAAVSKAGNTTNAVWRTVTYAIGGSAVASSSGDLYLDQAGQVWLLSSITPKAAYPLTLAITTGSPNGTITSATAGTTRTFVSTGAIAGGSVDPGTGINYYGGATANQILYSFTPGTTNSEVLADASAATLYTITDMGNCVVPPAKPTVTKSFSPTYAALTPGTSTLSINIVNSNTVPIWLNRTFTDQLPTGMTVAATPNLNSGACAASTTVTNVITATAGQTTMTFANGGRIPAGGCTISFNVTGAAQANGYTNTIAIGSLTTTSGNNTVAASATYKVGTDFSVTKTEGTGTTGPYTTGPLTVPGSTTIQYVLTITNSSVGGTGSATFSDTLPALVNPVLSITAGITGGGSCSTASAVIGGSTVVTGTLTNVPAGAICTVTITTRVSATQTAATAVTNTLTVAPTSSTSDTSASNNIATVRTTIGPSANITVTKTNGLITPVVAGTTVTYTITVVNLGPSQASGTLVTDPSTTGLSCFTVNCTTTGGATCPAASFPYSNMNPGVTLTPFPSASTATFVVSCGVTATGLP